MKKYGWLIGLGLALALAALSPWASPHPDGLERVAEDQGFAGQAQTPVYHLIPDYLFPGIADKRLATIVAGVVGTLLVFALTYGLARLLHRKSGAKRTTE